MALSHYVVIDGERYFVPEDSGVEAVRAELLNAVQSGGAYVALGRDGVGYTEVLVTALTPVRIEHITADVPSPRENDDEDEDTTDPGWWL